MQTELTIKAVDKYSSTLKKMEGVSGKFSDRVRADMKRIQSIRGPLKQIEDFRKQKKAVSASSDALSRAKEKQKQLLSEIRKAHQPSAKLRREYDRQRTAVDRLKAANERNRIQLGRVRDGLRGAGVNTSRLSDEQDRLSTSLNKATTGFDQQLKRMERVATAQKRMREEREKMDRRLSRAASFSFVGSASRQSGRGILRGVSNPLTAAKGFESAFGGVAKVVDFAGPGDREKLAGDIRALGRRIAVENGVIGFNQIIESAAQSGIAQKDLVAFAQRSAMGATAWDMSAAQTGEAMAKIKTGLKLSLPELNSLTDGINELTNQFGANAPDLVEFMRRSSAEGAIGGFSPAQTAAFGAAFMASGEIGADVASTSFRNMAKRLGKGDSATAAQRDGLSAIGLDAGATAQAMQADAVRTSLDVFDRIRALPAYQQGAVISQIFGDEARSVPKVLNNLELLRGTLELVSADANYAGSAQREFEKRTQTGEYKEQLADQNRTDAMIEAGQQLLEDYKKLSDAMTDLLQRTTKWMKAHPRLTKWIMRTTAAVGALALAGGALLTMGAAVIGSLAVMRFGLVGLGVNAGLAATRVLGVGGAMRGLLRVPKVALSKMVAPIKWTASLIPPIPWGSRVGKLTMTKGGWGRIITPLKWFGRGALRLIPVIGWAVFAAEVGYFLWSTVIRPVNWGEFISDVKAWMSENIFNFEWKSLLPDWDWSNIIPELPRFSLGGVGQQGGGSRGRRNDVAHGGAPTGRAVGGPFGKAPLLVGERGPELYFPNRSGFIANSSQLRDLLDRARKLTAATAVAGGVASGAAAGVNTLVHIGSVTIAVPPGMTSPERIVDLVEQRLGDRIGATLAASFSD